MSASEIRTKADFTRIRYAQCWEDADMLLEGLDIKPGQNCLAIASAGDNALAMLTRDPASVVALDLNPAQIFCLELRVAAYRRLAHEELLRLMGSRPCRERERLYRECRSALSEEAAHFWDEHLALLRRTGAGGAGKFENYFRIFHKYILPLCHSRTTVRRLFTAKSEKERERFYEEHWCNLRWKTLARMFFSRPVLGRLGRDPAFFAYVKESFSEHIQGRIRHALCTLEPWQNPYLYWILNGCHGEALPMALRKEHFEHIKSNLPRLEWHLISSEEYAVRSDRKFDRFNLSNIFEYMSENDFHAALIGLLNMANPGARLFYWNMLAHRASPESLRLRLRPLDDEAAMLHAGDKAFFYSRIIIEEVL